MNSMFKGFNTQMDRKTKQRVAVLAFLIALILIFLISNVGIVHAGISRSSETYNHLIDGTFYYEDSNSTVAKRFQSIAASILRVVYPFIAVFTLTVIVIKLSATVSYLTAPDFFDEVHYIKGMRRERKMSGQSSGRMAAFMQAVRQNGVGDSVIKGVLVPDFKKMAFYDACEIGEDGRPSMATFFKNKFPRYMVIIAMVIMINDQTMLQLIFRGAEVGVYFFQKAASFNYVSTIERFLNEGQGYDPGWKGAKKNVYQKIEKQLLALNKDEGTEKTEYKQKVGSRVATWMEANMGNIDWDNYRVTSSITVDAIQLPTLPPNTWQEEISSTFDVVPTEGTRYLTVRLQLENKNFWKPEAGKVRTTDPAAWSLSGNTLQLDLTKISGVGADIRNVKISTFSSSTPGSAEIGAVNGTNISFNIKDIKSFNHLFANVTYTDGNGSPRTATVVFANDSGGAAAPTE